MTEEEVLKALAEHEQEVAPVLRYYKASPCLLVLLRCWWPAGGATKQGAAA